MYNCKKLLKRGLMLLTIIVATLFISLVANIVLKKYDLPTIIGYILTGTIIAYGFGLHDAVHNHELKELAEFGVVFLMFTIGLEFSLSQLKRMRYEVFITGTLQILVTAAIVYLFSYYALGIEQKISIILALAIALSSTAIVLKTFNDNGEINKRHGQRALGILIMQDIAVIPILLLLGFLSSNESDVLGIIVQTIINAIILLALLFFLSKYFLEKFFIQITKTNSEELFIGSILFLAIGSSWIAYELGFSYSLGAFIAGMLISETKFKHQAEANLVPFRDILLGIFFITVGMQIDFAIIFSYIHIIVLLIFVIALLKFVIIYALVRISENKKTTFKTALALIQIGEFSLAVLELARSNSLIVPPYGQVMIVTIVISMIYTPILLKHLTTITDRVIKKEEDYLESNYVSSDIKDHVVILGYGEFGQSVAKVLREQGELYIIVENNINSYHKGVANNEPIIFGNALKKQILKNTYLQNAKRVIIAIDNPKKLYQICEIIQRYISSEKIIVKIHSHREAKSIEELNINHIVIENDESSRAVLKLTQD
jgi:CPA2 family monovalent cation:H+ antiporter-2